MSLSWSLSDLWPSMNSSCKPAVVVQRPADACGCWEVRALGVGVKGLVLQEGKVGIKGHLSPAGGRCHVTREPTSHLSTGDSYKGVSVHSLPQHGG